MKKLFNGTQEERNERRAQEEAIMNNEQTTDPLVSSEGEFVGSVTGCATAEYKQREDGCYEYTTKWEDGKRQWVFSPTHQLIEKTDYDFDNGREFQIEKTVYTKNTRTDDKVNERRYYQSWEDDNGEEQTDYDVIDAEGVTKTHSYQMSPYTLRTETMSYMKPDDPDDEINILNSSLSITDVRCGYTDGHVVEGIKPYGKKEDAPTDKSLIGVIRTENKKHCISGTTTVKVNLKTPLIAFRSVENHGSCVDPNYKNDVQDYTVMNKLFNKPAYEVRRASSTEFSDIVNITTHDYVYKDTIYGKALIDHEIPFTDIGDKLSKLPAVERLKTQDCSYTTKRCGYTTKCETDKNDLFTYHNQHLVGDLSSLEKFAAHLHDCYNVTIEGGKYDGSTFYFSTSSSLSDEDAGKYLWCPRIRLNVKDDGDTTSCYEYFRERKDAMTNKKAVAIDKYTDFIESIVAIINSTPDEIPDRKTYRTVKTSENGDKEITRKTLYRSYCDSTNSDNANS